MASCKECGTRLVPRRSKGDRLYYTPRFFCGIKCRNKAANRTRMARGINRNQWSGRIIDVVAHKRLGAGDEGRRQDS